MKGLLCCILRASSPRIRSTLGPPPPHWVPIPFVAQAQHNNPSLGCRRGRTAVALENALSTMGACCPNPPLR
eukprot:6398005-Amphidinium_carterae.1